MLALRQESVDHMSTTRFVVGMEDSGCLMHTVMER